MFKNTLLNTDMLFAPQICVLELFHETADSCLVLITYFLAVRPSE